MIDFDNGLVESEDLPEHVVAVVSLTVARVPGDAPVSVVTPGILVQPNHPENFDLLDLQKGLASALGQVMYERGIVDSEHGELGEQVAEIAKDIRDGYFITKYAKEQ
ncbi:hypothetical protein [Corynebacterium accolens]|uniref:hypothetical protein n=1 Tax=Corynebacterium accolens TaxID=38284 RepID=UPI0026700644|nr:hypothetical protein [Corynebacterium accolens]WKS54940.1 hypothetical protein NLL31_06825 [Corynebacterium accolens]